MNPAAPAPSIRLVPIDTALALRLEAAAGVFEGHYQLTLGEVAEQVQRNVELTLTHLPRPEGDEPWRGYLVARSDDGQIVGCCAFKDRPSAAGEVENAYQTYPPFENRGYARAMATALFEMARQEAAVRTVTAHTLPGPNASCRVLARCGFVQLDAHHDGDDGLVWRWARAVDTPAADVVAEGSGEQRDV